MAKHASFALVSKLYLKLRIEMYCGLTHTLLVKTRNAYLSCCASISFVSILKLIKGVRYKNIVNLIAVVKVNGMLRVLQRMP